MAELDGRLALVAGATRPHGALCAAALLQAGATVALVDRDDGPLTTLAQSLRALGPVAVYTAAIGDEAVRRALAEITENHGAVDILVTCPSPPAVGPSRDLAATAFGAAWEADTLHAFLWCQAAGRQMLAGGSGVIVNVTALSALGGWPGWLAQSAALAGIHNLTHTLAAEWTRFGVRVNCLVPGITERDLPDLLSTPEAPDRETVVRRIPMGRLANADDLGKALIYLVRAEASFISGEILRVDGAWDAWGRYYAIDPYADGNPDPGAASSSGPASLQGAAGPAMEAR